MNPNQPVPVRPSLLARILAWLVFALFLAALGAAFLAGLTAFLIFFVLLVPILLVLLVVALTGRGKISIRVHGSGSAPKGDDDTPVPRLKDDR